MVFPKNFFLVSGKIIKTIIEGLDYNGRDEKYAFMDYVSRHVTEKILQLMVEIQNDFPNNDGFQGMIGAAYTIRNELMETVIYNPDREYTEELLIELNNVLKKLYRFYMRIEIIPVGNDRHFDMT